MYIQLLFAKITHSFAKVLRLQLESFPRVSLRKSRAEFNYLRYETLHTRKSTLNFLKKFFKGPNHQIFIWNLYSYIYQIYFSADLNNLCFFCTRPCPPLFSLPSMFYVQFLSIAFGTIFVHNGYDEPLEKSAYISASRFVYMLYSIWDPEGIQFYYYLRESS